MALNTVTLQWNITSLVQSGQRGTLIITPTAQLIDTTDHVEVAAAEPVQVSFGGGTGQLENIVANDNPDISPSGTGYTIQVVGADGRVLVPLFTTQILYSNGATQWLDELAEVPIVTTGYQYLPLPSGTPVAGAVPVAQGSGQQSAWSTGVLMDETGGIIT